MSGTGDTHANRLLDRARGGDPSALDSLLQEYVPALRAFVRLRADRVVRAHENVSDIVQSAFLEIVQRFPKFEQRSVSAFRKWLFLTVEQKLVDRFRYWSALKRDPGRVVRETGSDVDELELLTSYASFCSPSRDAIAREELARVEEAFAELPAPSREAILLVRIARLSHAEAAGRMGRSVESMRHHLYRGLALLAEALAR